MAFRRLPHYFRSCRKAAGLSQDELAGLLGCRNGTKVSRYERFARRPTLETVLAYEAVFGMPARELCAGIYEGIRKQAARRAGALAEKVAVGSQTPAVARKLELLRRIAGKVEDAAHAA